MTQRAIPCLLMRGGTSRGPYFKAEDLPADIGERDRVLLAAMGSPDARQIDGLGGADTLTSKVAIISPSERDGVDINYLFAQVTIDKPIVDTNPSCGNMLSGVGPAALELGMMQAQDGETPVVIFNENTSSRIEAVIQTPGGHVCYDGDARIDGVPGTAAPIVMNFMDVVGSKTGAFFPTGNPVDVIDGVDVSCVDVAMPMIHMRASDFGITGHESRAELDANTALIERVEPIRRKAGELMGFGDVTDMVVPKVGLLAAPGAGGDICSRYYTPLKLHATHAVTGAVCVASAASVPGTLAYSLATPSHENPRDFVIEHPSGQIEVRIETSGEGASTDVVRAGILRTARLIMRGEVMVPA
ncbi:MAG: 4-oxalomesaconate tautomerase [Rhodospirillaceae bacterium]|nr:4-oxalomesaconate tautomerase [Rhodospirillaceae bacterium]